MDTQKSNNHSLERFLQKAVVSEQEIETVPDGSCKSLLWLSQKAGVSAEEPERILDGSCKSILRLSQTAGVVKKGLSQYLSVSFLRLSQKAGVCEQDTETVPESVLESFLCQSFADFLVALQRMVWSLQSPVWQEASLRQSTLWRTSAGQQLSS